MLVAKQTSRTDKFLARNLLWCTLVEESAWLIPFQRMEHSLYGEPDRIKEVRIFSFFVPLFCSMDSLEISWEIKQRGNYRVSCKYRLSWTNYYYLK